MPQETVNAVNVKSPNDADRGSSRHRDAIPNADGSQWGLRKARIAARRRAAVGTLGRVRLDVRHKLARLTPVDVCAVRNGRGRGRPAIQPATQWVAARPLRDAAPVRRPTTLQCGLAQFRPVSGRGVSSLRSGKPRAGPAVYSKSFRMTQPIAWHCRTHSTRQ